MYGSSLYIRVLFTLNLTRESKFDSQRCRRCVLRGFVHFRSFGSPNIMSNSACALHWEVKRSRNALEHSRAVYSQRLRYSGAILLLSFTFFLTCCLIKEAQGTFSRCRNSSVGMLTGLRTGLWRYRISICCFLPRQSDPSSNGCRGFFPRIRASGDNLVHLMTMKFTVDLGSGALRKADRSLFVTGNPSPVLCRSTPLS